MTTIDALILEGSQLLAAHQRPPTEPGHLRMAVWVDSRSMGRWRAGCLNLMRLLGKHGEPWRKVFEGKDEALDVASTMAGTLEAIKYAVENDLLLTVEDLVFAEAFSDLLEQAEHLLDGGYFLAAGVLGRAVLEEHLRKMCDREGCPPAVAKPTLNNFQTELQRAGHLNKIEAAHVLAMAAVGNTAAHNLPGLSKPDVERFVRDVRDFLVRHPL